MEAVSYFGVPFFDNQKRVIGHLAVLDAKPMPSEPRAKTILEIFAARAAAELVGVRAEDALRVSERALDARGDWFGRSDLDDRRR